METGPIVPLRRLDLVMISKEKKKKKKKKEKEYRQTMA